MKKSYKLLSLLLSAALVISCIPLFAFAEPEPSLKPINVFTETNFNDEAASQLNLGINTEGADGGITLKPNSGDITIKDGYWPAGNRTTKVSFDYTPSTGGEHFIWLAYDAEKNNGIGIRINNQDGGLLIRAWLLIEGTAKQFGDNSAKFLAYQWCNADALAQCKYNGKIHIEATIDYKSDTLAAITCTSTAELMEPTDDATTATVTHTVNYNLASIGGTFSNFGTASYGIMFDDANTGTNGTELSNLKVESYALKAQEFVETHSAILNKAYSDVAASDDQAINAALKDYDDADDGAKNVLDGINAKAILDLYREKADDILSDSAVAEYRASYAGVLALSTAEMTEDDIALFAEAIIKYNSMTSAAKAKLSGEKLLIDSKQDFIIANLADFSTIDFEEDWYYQRYLDTAGNAAIIGDTEIDGNKCLNLEKDAVAVIKSDYWTEGNKPASASIDIKFPNGTGKVYFAYDAATGQGIGLDYTIQDGGYMLKCFTSGGVTANYGGNSGKLATVTENLGYVDGTTYLPNRAKMGKWQRDKWTNVLATYDYSKWQTERKLTMTYIVTVYGYNYYSAESGYAELSGDTEIEAVTLPAMSYTYNFGENSGLTMDMRIEAKGSSIQADNWKISGIYSNETDLGKAFEQKYSVLLDKVSYDELSDAEKLLLEQAKIDYVDLSDEARQYLAESGISAKLAALLQDSEITLTYKDNYADIIALNEADVRPRHEAVIDAAIAEYKSLGVADQLILAEVYSKLLKLKQAVIDYVEPRPEGDYDTPFTDDFESGNLKSWKIETRNTATTVGTHEFKVVEDPDNPENSVLQIKADGGYITICDALWANGGVMKTATFKMKLTSENMEGNAFNKNGFYPSYDDPINCTKIAFNATGTAMMSTTYTDGDVSGTKGWSGVVDEDPVSPGGWLTVTVTYNGLNASSKVVDANSNVLSFTTVLPYEYGRLAFGNGSSSFKCNTIYIDDVNVTFAKGDYDTNTPPNDIQVYYSGNTEFLPGETVTVTGENLYKNVQKIQIMQIADGTSGTAKYIGEQSFQSLAAEGASEAVWDNSTARDVQILQSTATSFKFAVPSDFTKGIYAVKLYATNKGDISNVTGEEIEDVIIYLNNPDIRFYVGDEGKTATSGGYVRIVGSNLVLKEDNAKAVLRDSAGNDTPLNIAEFYDDEYALKVELPQGISGDYKILVYNGYGDDTCWSAPVSVSVKASPRDSWSKTVFNVKDYGATGDSETNDTAAIVSAMIAAAENGGGIVYLPRGIYRLTNTITIPENVVVKGDGINNTKVFWNPKNWMMGDAPDALLQFTSNVAIEDIAFYASRHKTVMRILNKGEASENIYIKNIYVHLQELTGSASSGDGTPIQNTGYTTAEMMADIRAEATKSSSIISATKVLNGQVENFDLWANIGCKQGVNGNWQYSYLYNAAFQNWSTINSTDALILEECYTTYLGACMGISGEVYVKNCDFNGHSTNNHEITTTDGTHPVDGVTMKFIGDDGSIMGAGNTDSVTYRVTGINYKKNALKGYHVLVISGQGVGQIRKIVSNIGSDITVDQPFAVKPNRNSLIAINASRSNGYFVDNYYAKGGAAGTYGSIINTVFDGNEYEEFGGQIFNTHAGVNWYTSIVNATLSDPFYMHGDGTGNTAQGQTDWGHWQFLLLHGLRPMSSLAYLFKGNQMLDGSYMTIQSNLNYLRDFVIEKNYFSEGSDFAIGINSGSDGVFIANNTYDCATMYSSSLKSIVNSINNTNIVNDFRYVSLENYLATGTEIGDVNGDGKVSMKDVTTIRYYLIDRIDLTSDQLDRADIDGDGKVTSNDVNLLRKQLLS